LERSLFVEGATVAGVPAKPVGKPHAEVPAFDMRQELE